MEQMTVKMCVKFELFFYHFYKSAFRNLKKKHHYKSILSMRKILILPHRKLELGTFFAKKNEKPT